MKLNHSLYSKGQKQNIAIFEGFNEKNIRDQIVNHLDEHLYDTVIHFKDDTEMGVYKVNLKTADICKVEIVNGKETFKPFTIFGSNFHPAFNVLHNFGIY